MKRPPNTLRIIGGSWRSRILRFPTVEGLRPTPDRARETLFNWLGQRLDGWVCLDAFAGSGALGFEAASRGAARVLMLELETRALAALREQARLLPAPMVEIQRADALTYLAGSGESFDLVFLDPPFAAGCLPAAVQLAATRLRPGGRIYAEAPIPLEADGLRVVRRGHAGHSHFCLLEPV